MANVFKRAYHAVTHPVDTLHDIAHATGLHVDAPPDITKSAPALALSKFAGQLSNEYDNLKNGVTPTVAPVSINTEQSNQARDTQQDTIGGLQGVASGATTTAADSLLTRGTDAASRNAMGTAAQYSAGNPGSALRQGLAASNDAYATAASGAAAMKANEQAAARGQLVDAANAMRTQDIGIAGANQNAGNAAQVANQAADLQQQGIDDNRRQALRGSVNQALAAPMGVAFGQQTTNQNVAAGNQVAAGGLASTLGHIISDERLKTDIRDGSGDADAFLDSLAPRDYQWKDPSDPRTTGPGEHLGVLAQDLPPRETGTGPDGAKFIRPEIISSVLAGMGRMHDRLMAVEGKKKPDPGDVKWGPNPYPKPYKPSSGGRVG